MRICVCTVCFNESTDTVLKQSSYYVSTDCVMVCVCMCTCVCVFVRGAGGGGGYCVHLFTSTKTTSVVHCCFV